MKPRCARKSRKVAANRPFQVRKSVAPADSQSEPAESEAVQPARPEFEEPAATEDREDPGTDVAPTRYDAPLDPHAIVRRPSLEGCGPPDEDAPEAADLDGVP